MTIDERIENFKSWVIGLVVLGLSQLVLIAWGASQVSLLVSQHETKIKAIEDKQGAHEKNFVSLSNILDFKPY